MSVSTPTDDQLHITIIPWRPWLAALSMMVFCLGATIRWSTSTRFQCNRYAIGITNGSELTDRCRLSRINLLTLLRGGDFQTFPLDNLQRARVASQRRRYSSRGGSHTEYRVMLDVDAQEIPLTPNWQRSRRAQEQLASQVNSFVNQPTRSELIVDTGSSSFSSGFFLLGFLGAVSSLVFLERAVYCEFDKRKKIFIIQRQGLLYQSVERYHLFSVDRTFVEEKVRLKDRNSYRLVLRLKNGKTVNITQYHQMRAERDELAIADEIEDFLR